MKTGYIAKPIISIVVCELAGLIGSIFSIQAIPTWYANLQKPAFTPPNWLFAPAWLTLYLLMGIAASIVWRRGLDTPKVSSAMVVFVVQIIFNVLWSAIFFGLRSPVYGVVTILILWATILLTMLRFFKISTVAGTLLVPYITWVSFAIALNVSIWLLNP